MSGTNEYDDQQEANFFDLSTTSFQYLQGVRLQFSIANAANPANLNKLIYLKAYSASANGPDEESASLSIELGRLHKKISTNQYTDVMFDKSMKLPASKKFFISVNMSNLSCEEGDSLSLVSTAIDDIIPGIAWDRWYDGTWHPYYAPEDWNINVALYIFPLVSTTETKCSDDASELISSSQNKTFVQSNSLFAGIKFANPFTGALKLQLNLTTQQIISAKCMTWRGNC